LAGVAASAIPGADRVVGPEALRLQILGPLRLWRGEFEVDPGPRQQAALLAVLLANADRPVSRSELIDLVWDEAPPVSALNVIHKYVGTLRRVLEPGLAARAPGSFLQRRGDGYLFDSRDCGLDLVAFRELLSAARQAATARREQPRVCLDRFVEALALWRGPAGQGAGLGLRAAAVFVALNGEFFDACVAAADLAVRLREPERVMPALHLAASMAPLDERVQAALITCLGAAGQRAEALALFTAVRTRLAQELGITPGPALRTAQRHVLADPGAAPIPDGPHLRTAGRAGARTGLIGRGPELDQLRHALGSALAGATGVVVVDGEPGVGKTRLLREMTGEAERRGALAVWGMCLEGNGTPSMWPWMRLVGAIVDAQPPGERAQWLAGELGRLMTAPSQDDTIPALPDGGARFRLFEQVVALVGRAAARRPLVIVVDDLQWADAASLEIFSHLSAQLPRGTLIVGALRDRAPRPSTELSRHLATASRAPGYHRFHLDAMGQDEVAELVRRNVGADPGVEAVRSIYTRTAGNPFFVQELSRLLADTGAITGPVAGSGVPATVRDVVRARTADLDDDVRLLLQIGALVGREATVTLLAHAAGIDIVTCLDRLEPLTALGVLESIPADPSSFQFPHDLVRESVAEVLPLRQATELHLRIADALESVPTDEESVAERLAFHLWAAGPLADPARTVAALVTAGDRAARKSAFEAAERHLQPAIRIARTAGLPELELSAVAPLADVFWKQGRFSGSYTDLLARAEKLARGLGQETRAADFLYMRVVVAFTHHHPDTEILMQRLIDDGETSTDPTTRAYARYLQARWAYEKGDVAAALRHMNDDEWTALDDARWRPNQLGDLQVFAPLFRALLTGMHGDVLTARALLRTAEDAAGDDPYAVSVWALWAVFTAEWVGDPAWALRIAGRWRRADPHHFFVNVDPPLQVASCWARALTGDQTAAAAAAAEAEQVVVTTMLDPPRFGVTRDYALLADMFVAAGLPEQADAALDQADRLAVLHDEPFAESLRLLIRAKALSARGRPRDVVLAATAKARSASMGLGAQIIARRADELPVAAD
jgi:DNA-binding SARP family transcriptional activator